MNKKKIFSKIFLASFALSLPFTGFGLIKTSTVEAGTSSLGNYSESVSLTNSSFNGISSTYSKNDVSGWSRIRANGSATTMIIDTQKNYSINKDGVYYLACDNPNDASSNKDDHKILMVNSSLKNGQKDGYAREGYRSSEITLDADSYYYFQVAMKTASFNNSIEFGSIYLSGLKDKDGNDISASFEKETAKEWTNYYFFVATGSESQTVTLDLWLGTEKMNSYGVAFFDEVYISKFSENLFYDSYHEDHALSTSTTKLIELDGISTIDTSNLNFDFEKDFSSESDKLVDWTIDGSVTNSIRAHAEVLNINSKEGFETKIGKTYPGNNFKYNNNQSAVLWTEEESVVAIKSNEIDIDIHGNYKVSMLVRTDLEKGSFFIKVNETEKLFSQQMFIDYEELKNNYPLHSGESQGISSTSGSKFNNDYQIVEFYIQGSSYYNSAVTLTLQIGNDSSPALGYAIVDDITLEYVSSSEYENATDKLSLAVSSSSESIKNGFFNFVESQDKDLTYPIAPKNFVISQEDKDNMAAGVINTFNDYYNTYKTTYDWGKIANPANVQNAPTDAKNSNNVFMFWNQFMGYQSLSNSDNLSLSAETYYEISFDFKTYEGALSVELINDDGVLLFKDNNVTANGPWEKYRAYIYTGEASHSIKAIVHFGTETEKVKGYAFIDNFKLTTSTSENFNTSPKNIDLSSLLLNLDPTNSVNSNLTDHPAFKGSTINGSDTEGGVIIGNGNTSFTDQFNNPIDKDQDLKNNVLVMRVGDKSAYKLTSTFKLDVEQDAYYSLEFKLLTNYFKDLEELPEKDEDGNKIQYDYGFSVGLSNFDATIKTTNNTGWKNYVILFKSTKTESVNLEFYLTSDHKGIYGTAFITDLKWEKSDEGTFSSAESKESYNKTLFTTQTSSSTEDSDESDSDNEQDSTTTSSGDINWLLIPSIITAVAVLIAVIGSLIRKINSGKKSIKKGKETYDRKTTLDKNVIKTEALKIQTTEIEKLNKDITSIKEEIVNLDQEHKEYIEEARSQNEGRITKDIEKQFKAYSNKRTKLTEKLQETEEHLKTVNSPEYLLYLEKKVVNDKNKTNK